MKFSNEESKLFDQLIETNKNVSYWIATRKQEKNYFGSGIFEDAISDLSQETDDADNKNDYGVKALQIIYDFLNRGMILRYHKVFQGKSSHQYFNSNIRMRNPDAPQLVEEGYKNVSQLIVASIINHRLVQYFFVKFPEEYEKLSIHIFPDEKLILEKYCPEFVKEMEDSRLINLLMKK